MWFQSRLQARRALNQCAAKVAQIGIDRSLDHRGNRNLCSEKNIESVRVPDTEAGHKLLHAGIIAPN
jgi:hypothetical protein